MNNSQPNCNDTSTVPPPEPVYESPGLYALSVLYERISKCMRCDLCKTRTQVVFGTGNFDFPDIAFVGDFPTKEEDTEGFPFLGPHGELLDKGITALGYKREDLYLVNAVSCASGRTPHAEEVAACRPVWQSQLIAVQPKVIVALGALAGNAILERADDLRVLRGKWHEWRGFPVRVTYAPAYVARTESAKAPFWEDLQQVTSKLGQLRLGI